MKVECAIGPGSSGTCLQARLIKTVAIRQANRRACPPWGRGSRNFDKFHSDDSSPNARKAPMYDRSMAHSLPFRSGGLEAFLEHHLQAGGFSPCRT
jgi:hypothetical protein